MPNNESKTSLFQPPIFVDIKNAKTEEKTILELDPTKIKPGEALIVRVRQFGGLKNEFFAVMNVDGKRLIVEELKRRQSDQEERKDSEKSHQKKRESRK